MKTPKLRLVPLRTGILRGHDQTVSVLIRVIAPGAPNWIEPARAPLNLALVLDRSGSMSGKPLTEAKRCAKYVVDSLHPSDTVSIVTYDQRVDVIASGQPASNRSTLHEAIRSITSGGTTALFDGWRLGADQAFAFHSADRVSRVLMLSDGNANAGLRDPDRIVRQVADLAASGVTTSTYGLGQNFNENLMMRMAQAGGGNAYYGETASDLIDPFNEELALLNALCVRRPTLVINTPPGVTTTMRNNYLRTSDNAWQLPDIAWESEAWAIADIHIPAAMTQRTDDTTLLLQALISCRNDSDETETTLDETLVLPVVSAAAFETLRVDELVRSRLQEIQAAELQERARKAARKQDWNSVDRLLDEARVESEDNIWLKESLASLTSHAARRETEQFSKEAAYASLKMRSRLADPDEVAASFDVSKEAGKAAFLRRKRAQGKDA